MADMPAEGTAERLRLAGWMLLFAALLFLTSAWFFSGSEDLHSRVPFVMAIAVAALLGSVLMFVRARRLRTTTQPLPVEPGLRGQQVRRPLPRVVYLVVLGVVAVVWLLLSLVGVPLPWWSAAIVTAWCFVLVETRRASALGRMRRSTARLVYYGVVVLTIAALTIW